MKNKTITTEQFNLMAKHIVSILSGEDTVCTYRFLINNVMGLDETYYSLLYPAGQDLTNTLAEVTRAYREIERLKNSIAKATKCLEQVTVYPTFSVGVNWTQKAYDELKRGP